MRCGPVLLWLSVLCRGVGKSSRDCVFDERENKRVERKKKDGASRAFGEQRAGETLRTSCAHRSRDRRDNFARSRATGVAISALLCRGGTVASCNQSKDQNCLPATCSSVVRTLWISFALHTIHDQGRSGVIRWTDTLPCSDLLHPRRPGSAVLSNPRRGQPGVLHRRYKKSLLSPSHTPTPYARPAHTRPRCRSPSCPPRDGAFNGFW